MSLKFRRIADTAELEKVLSAIKADNDSLFSPSHVATRNGEIVGAASLAVLPLACAWNHTQKITAKDSMQLKMVYDCIMETKGFSSYFIACNKQSPYNGHMIKLGFNPVWNTDIFVGGVKTP